MSRECPVLRARTRVWFRRSVRRNRLITVPSHVLLSLDVGGVSSRERVLSVRALQGGGWRPVQRHPRTGRSQGQTCAWGRTLLDTDFIKRQFTSGAFGRVECERLLVAMFGIPVPMCLLHPTYDPMCAPRPHSTPSVSFTLLMIPCVPLDPI